jgi:acyl carrier protein
MVKLEDILAIIGAIEPPPDMSEFDPNRTFSDNGIDSLDMMSVFLAIEEKYEFKFTDAELEQIRNTVDLVATVNRKLGQA